MQFNRIGLFIVTNKVHLLFICFKSQIVIFQRVYRVETENKYWRNCRPDFYKSK